ncbi:MAG: META domain-containing protein [Bacteroidetes bacterium]|nr:META domain-containing protein [Bacteroidota bacterium]
MKKTIFFLLCIYLLFFTSCSKKYTTESENKGNTEMEFRNILWRLKSVETPDSLIVPDSSRIYTICFNNDTTFSGQNDCNTLSGFYHVPENQVLIITAAGGTKAGCGRLSWSGFTEALYHARSYSIDSSYFKIFYSGSSKMNFEK